MFPAFTSFFAEPERTPARIAVYVALQPPVLDFREPRPVKLESLARLARVHVSEASRALRWLIDRGYLTVHSTDRRKLRTVTLEWCVRRSDAA